MHWWQGETLGQGIYIAGKIWIIALPIVWWLIWREPTPGPVRRDASGVGMGMLIGMLMAGVIVGGYFLIGTRLVDAEQVRAISEANGLTDIRMFLAFALYLSFVNAFIEEVVWRWFVVSHADRALGSGRTTLAIVIGGLAFTLHHTLALRLQMPWSATLLASAGILLAAMVWSWMFLKYRTVWGAYISHIMADLAVFVAAWHLIFGGESVA